MPAGVPTADVARYVLPVGQEPALDVDGFLVEPDHDDWRWGTGSRPVSVRELIHADLSWVMLAPGGVGKTTVMEQLAGLDPQSRVLDLSGLDKRAIHETLLQAAHGGGSVYADALDVVALEEPSIFVIFERVMREASAAALRWRLACRPAAWSARLGDALRRTAPGYREFHLLPLTRAAAREIVACAGVDAQVFLDALTASGLGRRSLSPQTLLAVADQWRDSGVLPRSQVDAIRYEIRRLLQERNPDYGTVRVAASRRYRLAGRLAALAVFGGFARFSTAATQELRALPIAELPDTPEPDEPGTPVATDQLREVLGTALFAPAPNVTVAFRHQQYAEFLAAEYVSWRPVTEAQLPAIVGLVKGVLPGPLAGVGAWLCALQPQLGGILSASNASAIAMSGVDLPDVSRATLVDALLAGAAQGDVEPAWGLDLTVLAHPTLEAQLVAYLERLVEPSQVWWLSRLAEAGACAGLSGRLLALALDPAWGAWARRAAAGGVAALGDDAQRTGLRRLLNTDEDSDPDDELLAAAIDALYPRLLTTHELLEALRPRRNRNLVGAYLILLGELAQRVPAEDLPVALVWAAVRARDDSHEGHYGRLIGQLIDRAWCHVDDEVVRHALAQLVASLDTAPLRGLGAAGPDLPWLGHESLAMRRLLAVAVAEHVAPDAWHKLLRLGLLDEGDADWLFDQVSAMPEPERHTLAQCLPHLLRNATVPQIDRVLSLNPDHPAYEATRGWRDPVSLDSPIARHGRREHQQARQRETDQQRARHDLRNRLTSALTAARTDVGLWWRVAEALGMGGRGDDALFFHDLTARPGWIHLDEDERNAVFTLGLQYLRHHSLTQANWLAHETLKLALVYPDWAGVYLLSTLARHKPDTMKQLPTATWRTWGLAIVAAWSISADPDVRLRGDVVELASAEGRAAIVDAALRYAEAMSEARLPLYTDPVLTRLCPDMAPAWAQRILDNRYTEPVGRTLIDMLARHAPTVAIDVCRHVSRDPQNPLMYVARRTLGRIDPGAAVDGILESGSVEHISQVASNVDIGPLDDRRLCAFARALLDLFPYAEDPPLEEGFAFASQSYETRQVRNRVLAQLAERGLADALEQLRTGRGRPDRALIGMHLQTARARAADIGQHSLQPHQLIELLARGDARLVRNADNLMGVVMEQLGEVQHHITREAFRFLWNTAKGSPARPKSEDDISDWVRWQLEHRLRSGVLVDREIQVQRIHPRGIGTRIDLTVTAATATQPAATARVVIEAKLINSSSLQTALHDQLITRYLQPAGLRHGIYLVYWIDYQQRPPDWQSAGPANRAALSTLLENQCANAANAGLDVRPFVLDISHPQSHNNANDGNDEKQGG